MSVHQVQEDGTRWLQEAGDPGLEAEAWGAARRVTDI
jgi:hypothetical protein